MATSIADYKHETPNDARQVRSRNALTNALLELLQERPFDHLTIREITAKAGTGYATFFRHYPTKEDLLGDIASEKLAELIDLATPILFNSDSRQSTLAMCRQVAENRALWTALLTGGAASIVRNEFIRLARQLPNATTEGADWLPADLGVVYGTGATFDLLAWWLSQDDESHSPEEIADILNRLIIRALVGKHAG